MNDFIKNIMGGTTIGILLGIPIVILLWLYSTSHYLSDYDLAIALDKNITVKELYWNCYPDEYKMGHTDWKLIRKIDCPLYQN